MRHAPPVQVRCHGAGWRVLQSLLIALAAGVFTLWLLLHAGRDGWPAAAVALLAGAVAWRLLGAAAVDLVWDGQRWLAGGQAGAVDVMLDMGGCMLLRLRPQAPARARWIAVSPHDAGPAMHGLRAALFAHLPPAPAAGLDNPRSC